MKIEIREAALEELRKVQFGNGEGIRILAEFVGTCSIATDIQLQIEEKKASDEVMTESGINFFVPEKSLESLPDKIFLDFKPGFGYKISSAEETFGYNFKLKPRNEK
ncbi:MULTISPECIES: iron-sulfur cluster biosynthesis family protein [unclassified Bacillus (in: firmicutes)]|uniref:iron-sulfur cluster biosynthesis family protein n=1 Tax=unclassified Bacillus (in: firmicutes) TaxID=185979 RepID=UPI001BEA37DC|nr:MULTISPECIES: iron-sulfur cluster biosynthesis family protein [unclassified Bacillus (in: firmicutes)]MBT2638465.1 iron-sulfur cluster biosynthesis family protein [Bacillus sp. ISL-39]MBT2662169.1 iron-sulfur cluster biosynthesis family protein [Bacillus sp. ISL-45]